MTWDFAGDSFGDVSRQMMAAAAQQEQARQQNLAATVAAIQHFGEQQQQKEQQQFARQKYAEEMLRNRGNDAAEMAYRNSVLGDRRSEAAALNLYHDKALAQQEAIAKRNADVQEQHWANVFSNDLVNGLTPKVDTARSKLKAVMAEDAVANGQFSMKMGEDLGYSPEESAALMTASLANRDTHNKNAQSDEAAAKMLNRLQELDIEIPELQKKSGWVWPSSREASNKLPELLKEKARLERATKHFEGKDFLNTFGVDENGKYFPIRKRIGSENRAMIDQGVSEPAVSAALGATSGIPNINPFSILGGGAPTPALPNMGGVGGTTGFYQPPRAVPAQVNPFVQSDVGPMPMAGGEVTPAAIDALLRGGGVPATQSGIGNVSPATIYVDPSTRLMYRIVNGQPVPVTGP